MAHLTPQARTYFETHHGVASATTLSTLGVGRARLKTLQCQGVLEQVLQGAYRLVGTARTELSRCASVCAAHPDLAIAGPTAGRILGLRRLPRDEKVHALAPPASNPSRAPWLMPYRTTAFHQGDLVRRADGIVITSGARTAFDLARWLTPDSLLSVIEQVMKDDRLTEDDMRRVAVDWLSPRRKWVRMFLEQLDRRLPGGAAESHQEVLVGDALQAAGMRGLARQHWIDLPGYGPARFDLAVPQLRWAIEIDAFPTHTETVGRSADEWRDSACGAVEWDVTRLTPSMLGHTLPITIDTLMADYRKRSCDER